MVCWLQAAEDSARLTELQESVMSLTKQVQQLLPLQSKCSTLEVERDTAQHKLDRLQVSLNCSTLVAHLSDNVQLTCLTTVPTGCVTQTVVIKRACQGLLAAAAEPYIPQLRQFKLLLTGDAAAGHLQEHYDQLQRQLQQAIARESELRASLDTYKTEHMQLLTANSQLVEKCQELSKKVQVRHLGP